MQDRPDGEGEHFVSILTMRASRLDKQHGMRRDGGVRQR